MSGLPSDIQKEINDTIADTACNKGMQVVLAINYGGRDEIIRAFKKYLSCNKTTAGFNEENFKEYLDNPDIPDPDLIIRSAGEHRTSNFLLWESAYSELYFSQKLWPEWDKEDLITAIESFKKRVRRFGAVNEVA